jgi:hypothetical protein
MTTALPVLESEERQDLFAAPHYSFSRLSKYLTCPEQFRLYYLEGLRPRFPPASLVFGQVLHQALAELLGRGLDPVKLFQEKWRAVQSTELKFGARDSWDKLLVTGEQLLSRFQTEELPKLGKVESVEKPFSLEITTLALPFVGIIDLIADYQGKRTVIDFKTAAKAYEDHEVKLADQLTAYQLAEPSVEQSALCVLIKGKDARIDWHVSTRGPKDLDEYLTKIAVTAQAIEAGHFYKRPGFWCTWCDFLPVCLEDKRKAKETLIQL